MDSRRYPIAEVIKICQEKDDLVSTRIGVTPARMGSRIEKGGHQPIIVRCASLRVLGFKNAGPLKLSEALQLIARETAKQIEQCLAMGRKCGS